MNAHERPSDGQFDSSTLYARNARGTRQGERAATSPSRRCPHFEDGTETNGARKEKQRSGVSEAIRSYLVASSMLRAAYENEHEAR